MNKRLRLGTTERLMLVLLAVLPILAAVGDPIPALKATTLAGGTVSLPAPKVQILMFGFTQKADKAFTAWDALIAPAFSADPRVVYLELPVIQRAPGLVRPLILRGMRKSKPAAEHSRYAPLTQQEEILRKLVAYKGDDAAYLVVANASGKVVWQAADPPSPASFAELRKSVESLLR